ALRLAICILSASTSAAAKVGSSVARTSPALTRWPSRTSSVLMIDGSSACSTTVGWVVTMLAEMLVTTRSSRVTRERTTRLTRNAPSTYTIERTPRGSGASRISDVSDWNRRTILSGGTLLGGGWTERDDLMR